jgi:hypothetical protein
MTKHHVYKALKMWIELFKWDNALELALKHGKHVEVVCWYRKEFLRAIGGKGIEIKKNYIEIMGKVWFVCECQLTIQLDLTEEAVLDKIRLEDEKEIKAEMR